MALTAGKVAWVIGATGTIGRAVADRLRADGVVVVGSSRDTGEVSQSEATVDLRNSASITNAFQAILGRHGGVDILVVSAAAAVFGDIFSLTDAEWRNALDTKLMGSVLAIRQVAPHMLERGSGRIILLTGRGSPLPQHLPGTAANAALNVIVQSLGAAWSDTALTINAVAPGPVASERRTAMNGGQASGNALDPADIADAVAFLCSDGARGVSGSTIIVDRGGRRSLTR